MADDEPEKKKAKKDMSAAILWFYRDKEGRRQGPFYPGQMRQWYQSGFFPPTQALAPSFKGEVPRTFQTLADLFPSVENAFVARQGIALWPPPQDLSRLEEAVDVDDGDDDDRLVVTARPPPRPQWLEKSLERQRAGIKRKVHYAPVERENYN